MEVVYVIEGAGRVKIGRSLDPLERLGALRTGSPVPLQLLGTVACPAGRSAPMIERLLHERYAVWRSHGEWFELPVAQLAELARVLVPAGVLADLVPLPVLDRATLLDWADDQPLTLD